jgi:sulfur-oxidizing protein SoxZ
MVARVQLPQQARRGEVIEVRIAIQHPMETGFRYDQMGKPVPKNVINSLKVRYGGTEVFSAELGSGIAANPYLQFCTVAESSAELVFEWVDDNGIRGSERAALTVTGD